MKLLAQRFGVALPEMEESDEQRANAAERETLLKVHESAAAWFQQQLASNAGARIRRQIEARGITDATSQALGLGYAPNSRDALKTALLKEGFAQATLLRAGLFVERDDRSVVDRFRNRLMIPICRDTGSVIAFGGRAVDLNAMVFPRGRQTEMIVNSMFEIRRDRAIAVQTVSMSRSAMP